MLGRDIRRYSGMSGHREGMMEDKGNGDARKEGGSEFDVILTIVRDKDGSIGVKGPIDKAEYCYGVLEMAKEVVRSFRIHLLANQQQSQIIKPQIKIGGFLDRFGRRKH